MPGLPFIAVCVKLFLGFFAAIFAIMLWARCRDGAWLCMSVAAVMGYLDALYSTLRLFGLSFSWDKALGAALGASAGSTYGNVTITGIVVSNLPWLFFDIAFLVVLVRKYR
jgi:hypothetical protein